MRAGTSARFPEVFMYGWRYGEGYALLEADAEGDEMLKLSHSSEQ